LHEESRLEEESEVIVFEHEKISDKEEIVLDSEFEKKV